MQPTSETNNEWKEQNPGAVKRLRYVPGSGDGTTPSGNSSGRQDVPVVEEETKRSTKASRKRKEDTGALDPHAKQPAILVKKHPEPPAMPTASTPVRKDLAGTTVTTFFGKDDVKRQEASVAVASHALGQNTPVVSANTDVMSSDLSMVHLAIPVWTDTDDSIFDLAAVVNEPAVEEDIDTVETKAGFSNKVVPASSDVVTVTPITTKANIMSYEEAEEREKWVGPYSGYRRNPAYRTEKQGFKAIVFPSQTNDLARYGPFWNRNGGYTYDLTPVWNPVGNALNPARFVYRKRRTDKKDDEEDRDFRVSWVA